MHRSAAALAAVLLLAACTGDDTPTLDPGASPTPATSATTAPSASAAGSEAAVAAEADPGPLEVGEEVVLSTDLSGAAAYPGPGDDGSGTFRATLAVREDAGQEVGELCYELGVRGLSAPVAAAHVHRGAAGEAGEVVVPLSAPQGNRVDACADVPPADLARLVADPTVFYVNVHTDDFPDGAVRGQLQPDGTGVRHDG